MKSTFNMLFLGDYKANTGYGTVSKNLLPYFKENFFKPNFQKWTLDICAVNFFGDLGEEDEHTTVFSALKSADFSKNQANKDDFGRPGFLKVLHDMALPPQTAIQVQPGLTGPKVTVDEENVSPDECGYDGIFIIQDVPVVTGMIPIMADFKREFKKHNRKSFKSIIYFPADFGLMPVFVKDLEFFDAIVTYNEYSRAAVLKWAPHLKGKIKVIPHGTNTKEFYPIADRELVLKFRKEYFGDENASKYIVTNLNRNQPRKDIPCTIFGFEEFHRNNSDSFLYLHMNPVDPKGHDLRAVLSQTSLQEGIDYMLPEVSKQNHGYSTEELNLIYNASDVFLTTTLGEGWSLSLTEAMACGLPVICPLNTSLIEITDNGKRAYVLENQYPICLPSDNAIRQQCDYLEVFEKLAMVHGDMEQLKYSTGKFSTPGTFTESRLLKKTEAALKYVQSLTWESIGEKWVQLMKDTY